MVVEGVPPEDTERGKEGTAAAPIESNGEKSLETSLEGGTCCLSCLSLVGFGVRQGLAATLFSGAAIVWTGGVIVIALAAAEIACECFSERLVSQRAQELGRRYKHGDTNKHNPSAWPCFLCSSIVYIVVTFLGCCLQQSFCPASTGIVVASPAGFECTPYICTNKGALECDGPKVTFGRRLSAQATSRRQLPVSRSSDRSFSGSGCLRPLRETTKGDEWGYFTRYGHGWFTHHANGTEFWMADCAECARRCLNATGCAAIECHNSIHQETCVWWAKDACLKGEEDLFTTGGHQTCRPSYSSSTTTRAWQPTWKDRFGDRDLTGVYPPRAEGHYSTVPGTRLCGGIAWLSISVVSATVACCCKCWHGLALHHSRGEVSKDQIITPGNTANPNDALPEGCATAP